VSLWDRRDFEGLALTGREASASRFLPSFDSSRGLWGIAKSRLATVSNRLSSWSFAAAISGFLGAMSGSIDFRPSWIKIKGANSNIDQLRKLTVPLDRSLYEIRVEKKSGPFIYLNPPSHYELTYRPKEPIPETLANVIGHAFGDFRSALDYLAKRIGIARIPGFDPEKPFYFPAAPRKDLPAHSSLAPIDKAIPGFEKLLLEEIRPENGPNEHLWTFADLNNYTKHSDFIPVVTALEVVNINAKFGESTFENCRIGGNAASPKKIIRSPWPIAIENNFKTTVEVTFGKGTSFENESVIPTLLQISEIVSETLKAIERLIKSLP
jgi:hypothetical protein